MPGTVDDAARSALAAAGSSADFLKAVDWASDRYRELTSRSRFRSLRTIGELSIPAVLSTGTVAATRGSKIVTGNAAAQAAWIAAGDQAGRYFRTNRVWYRIGALVVTGAATAELRLESDYAEDSVTAAAYKIIQRYTRLDPRARHLGTFVWMRFGHALESLTLRESDIQFADRLTVTAGGPHFVIEVGTDTDGVRLVEIYPYPSRSELIHYVFWPHTPRLRPGDPLPEPIDPYALREGVLIDIYRYEMAKAIRAGQIEQAALWRNEARAQVQSWEQAIRDANQADKGIDDVSFVLRAGTSRVDRMPFVNNSARSEIYWRGNRP